MIGERRRHTRLHDAMGQISAEVIKSVEVPEDVDPHYYQKYVHMVAMRCGMRVKTGLKRQGGKVLVSISER